jgi:hypothetical protein
VSQKPAALDVGLARRARIGVVVQVEVPAIAGHVDHGVSVRLEKRHELIGRADPARQPAADAHDRDAVAAIGRALLGAVGPIRVGGRDRCG